MGIRITTGGTEMKKIIAFVCVCLMIVGIVGIAGAATVFNRITQAAISCQGYSDTTKTYSNVRGVMLQSITTGKTIKVGVDTGGTTTGYFNLITGQNPIEIPVKNSRTLKITLKGAAETDTGTVNVWVLQ